MIKGSKKTSQHSTERKKGTKNKRYNPYILDDYINALEGLSFFRKKPLNETQAELLALKLIKYATDKENGITLVGFCQQEGIGITSLKNWAKKFPRIKAAVAIAKEFIGNNREEGALKRTLDASIVKHTMPLYSEEIKALEQERTVYKEALSTLENAITTFKYAAIPHTKEVDEHIKKAKKHDGND